MTIDSDKRIADLETENARLRRDLEIKSRVASRALASFQQRALHMEIIRQQNEDLDRLAADLARAKKAEEERSREVEEAARLKSEFLANFSHEIRTPLNGIIGYCELLSREEGSSLTPHGRRDLNVIKSNARTLLSLINDILDLSKIEAGRVEVLRALIELEPIVEECVATAREYLKGKDVEMQISLAEDARILFTDGLKLRQILLNLLSNAAKFTESGEIVVSAVAQGKTLILSVEDTGVGIPADQVPYIFDKFRQVDGSSTRKVGGTGLGLAIVRELSRLLGGSVEVSSTYGRGTSFRVVLPGAIKGVQSAPTSSRRSVLPEVAQLQTGSKVLLVDDDMLIQQLMRTQLDEAGFKVLVAGDGVEALRMLREQKPAAVILDIHLPKLDGWNVLQEIKSEADLAGTPVVILSVQEERARAYSLGACEYLLKPIEPDLLVTAVRRAISPGSGDVLIVDDDLATRELLARHLRKVGFSIVEAQNGAEAIARAQHAAPALVVLDLIMPDKDGFDVLRALRTINADIPIVVLTGKELSEEETGMLRDGLAAVVQKNGDAIESVIKEAKRIIMAQRSIEVGRTPRVLYVEDLAQNRDIVRRYLHGLYDVIEAEDGEHGLERAERDMPDLILMDLSLPRMDGWEATRRLKANAKLNAIPVIALTAHASREDQERARAVGCIDYLTKPLERDVLLKTIRRYLQAKVTNG